MEEYTATIDKAGKEPGNSEFSWHTLVNGLQIALRKCDEVGSRLRLNAWDALAIGRFGFGEAEAVVFEKLVDAVGTNGAGGDAGSAGDVVKLCLPSATDSVMHFLITIRLSRRLARWSRRLIWERRLMMTWSLLI